MRRLSISDCILAVLVLALAEVTLSVVWASPSWAYTKPDTTTSVYEKTTDLGTIEAQAVAQASNGRSGTVILDFGRPAYSSTSGTGYIDFSNVFVTRAQVLPLTLVVVLVAGIAVVTAVSSANLPSSQRPAASASSQPVNAVQKPRTPPNPAPKTAPPHPIPLDPVSTGPLPMPIHARELLVGDRVAAAQLPYDHHLFATTSFYEYPPTSVYVDLAAGNLTSSQRQGVLRVISLDPYGSDSTADYPTPSATGPLTITAVQGSQVNLVSSDGDTYQFNLATRAYS